MMGLAARPGTEVLPKWWISTSSSARSEAGRADSRSKAAGQSGSYSVKV